jgi:sulfatase modifying factor 1
MLLHAIASTTRRVRVAFALAACCIIGCSTSARNTPPASYHDLVRIPGGAFTMGTGPTGVPALLARYGFASPRIFVDEVPARSASVAPFEMDRTEVTRGAFREFLLVHPAWQRAARPAGSHTGRYLEGWTGAEPPAGTAGEPVAFITWPAAVAYCAWRGRRLPTEAEWEWAARGGRVDPEFPWGDAMPDSTRANWGASRIGRPVPVGRYPPNGYGLHDMAGNVWEFTADPWQREGIDAPDASATRYVIRGGSYGAGEVNLRVRWRDSHPAGNAGDHVGFRCAR